MLCWRLASLVWQPMASPLRIGAGGAVLAALAVFAYLRVARDRPRAALLLLMLRLGAIAVVSLLLCGPSREVSQGTGLSRPRLSILVDTSESMLTGDCAGESRIEHVGRRVLGPNQLQALAQDFEVELQGFDVDLHPLSVNTLHTDPNLLAQGRATHLAACTMSALTRAARPEGGQALLIVSDGRDTEDASVQPTAALARSRGVPIYTLGVGGTQSSTDAAILAVPQQDALLPGEPGGVLVKVYHSGIPATTGRLQVVCGEETQRIPIRFEPGVVAETQVTVQREEPGQYEFEMSLDPLPGETELANNTQTVFIEVLRRRIRVLLLEGEPFWDTKFLAQSLRKDEQVELTQITQVGETKREQIVTRSTASAPRVPETAEQWGEYDVVMLGRNVERLLSDAAARSLVAFVSTGGGRVVFARGPAWDSSTPAGSRLQEPLAVLEPVTWMGGTSAGGPLELTASGRTAAWFAATKLGVAPDLALGRLPGLESLADVAREKSGTLVLARAAAPAGQHAEPRPAIARMAYGRGQIVAILGEGLWRWSLLPPQLHDLRGFYDTFWSNLVRWLALGGDFTPGQQVSLQLSRTSLRLRDELTIDVAYKQAPPSGADPHLEVTGPDGRREAVALHELPGQTPRFRATLTPDATGVYRVVVTTPGAGVPQLSRKFNVYEVNLERLQTSANFLTLQMLAEHSGGMMFDAAAPDAWQAALQRHRAATIVPPRLEYIWDSGLLMTLLLVWAGVEWLARRLVGLW